MRFLLAQASSRQYTSLPWRLAGVLAIRIRAGGGVGGGGGGELIFQRGQNISRVALKYLIRGTKYFGGPNIP